MKIERTTVSLPGELMAAAQRHCEATSIKFSNYVEKLVRNDLTAEGKMISPDQQDEELKAAVKELGHDVVMAACRRIARGKKAA